MSENGRSNEEVTLVTGFPAYTAVRMIRRIAEAEPKTRLLLLAREKFRRAAEELARDLPEPQRVEVLVGDVCDMDLGLSGAEYRALTACVTTIHHLASIYYLGVPRELTQRVNIDGTRGMLDFAVDCTRLKRFCHYSTAQVSGKRVGVILEEELDEGQRFRNVYEETKFESERLVQSAARRLPTTVFRPGVIVGDSKTGEIDKFDGPYYLVVLIVGSPVDLHLPLPGKGSAPLPIVPIDYVIDAAYALSRDGRAVGRTFHLTDPCPLSARTVYEIVAARAGKKPPRGIIPPSLARAVLRTPWLDRLAAPLAFLEAFNHLAFYNPRGTLELLRGTGIECPPFETYVDRLIGYVQKVQAARRSKLEDEVFDPFD
jgi:nucleoside-diphosphate-sugar epimerase